MYLFKLHLLCIIVSGTDAILVFGVKTFESENLC